MASSCDGQDSSLLMYGINPGEKVRNRVDFMVPRNVSQMQRKPAALEGGGWRWPITDPVTLSADNFAHRQNFAH